MTRNELTRAAQDALPRMAVGNSMFFDLPKEQPARRVMCQALNCVAYKTFGARSYRLKSTDEGVWITRTNPMLHPVSQSRLRDALERADA